MRSSSLLILALSALSSALPTCETPQGFTINGFTTFTPAAGNVNPAEVSFSVSDDQNSTNLTFCSHAGDFQADVPVVCDNGSTEFLWDGGSLTIGVTYTPCSGAVSAQAFGNVTVSVFCFPSEPPIPNGFGTELDAWSSEEML
ncbi:hypothetical protein G7Y89_g945 [Cudoniella acicularis]|uniref:AA1-like domain-containing protein n=1 Tax=Cudoniella acicularis TaxID=354080 RepID=A0A8H4RW83_9HELO|nr:hypothetical protein G7Y89_g945 [Cudoniella acicularis]